MDLAPQRALGYSELPREVWIESALAVVFLESIAHRACAAVVHGEGHDCIVLALDTPTRIQIGDLDRKAKSVHPELLRALERALRTARSPEAQRLRAPLKGHGSHQSDHADHVIGVEMREEDVGEAE